MSRESFTGLVRRRETPAVVDDFASGTPQGALDMLAHYGRGHGQRSSMGRRLAAALTQEATLLNGFNSSAQTLLARAIALEALTSDQRATSGTTDRFVIRVSALLRRSGIDRTECSAALRLIYDERSALAHQGFARSSMHDVGHLAEVVHGYLAAAIPAFIELVETQTLWLDRDLTAWLDAPAR